VRKHERDGWEERDMSAFGLLSDLCQFGYRIWEGSSQSREKDRFRKEADREETLSERKQIMQLSWDRDSYLGKYVYKN